MTHPIRTVVFASEQLFPSLQFLLHLADRYKRQLLAIYIYHTDDERRSKNPALRLKQVMANWLIEKRLPCEIQLIAGTASPVAVHEGLMTYFSADPDCHWLVNVTGGTKPMSTAATQLTLSTDLPHKRVIYQEINGDWWEINDDESTGLFNTQFLSYLTDPVVPTRDTLERLLPIKHLVATQFSNDHHITTQTIKPFPVDAALDKVIAKKWQWSNGLLSMLPPVQNTGNGDAFERFIGAGLLDSGLKLEHSLKVNDQHNASHKVVREVDLVGCHLGQLICIDIKLPGAEEHAKGTQLADVAELAHSLGGRGALAVAIRPGWKQDDDMDRLAKALGVLLLSQNDAPQIFSRLLKAIDKNLIPSDHVLAAEKRLQAENSKGNDVLSDGRSVVSSVADSGIFNLSNVIETISQRRQEPWGLVQMNGAMYWLSIPKKQLPISLQTNWAHCSSLLEKELHALSLPNTRFPPRDTPAWAHFQFILNQGRKAEDVRHVLRKVLQTAT